jgi:Domain of unknown function (DUF222)
MMGTCVRINRTFREVLADRRYAADPGPEEQRACRQYAARRVSLSSLPDGMGRIEGSSTPSGLALLRTAIDALAGPGPATVPDEQRRTPEQRNADATLTFHPPLGWPHHQPQSRRTQSAPRTTPPPTTRHPGDAGQARDPNPPPLTLIE